MQVLLEGIGASSSKVYINTSNATIINARCYLGHILPHGRPSQSETDYPDFCQYVD